MSQLRYPPEENCHEEIQEYLTGLRLASDDDDPDKRDITSVDSYAKDLRWYQTWLWDNDIENPSDVDRTDAKRCGQFLGKKFNGTTGNNRWRTINNFYQEMVIERKVDENPFSVWNDTKDQRFGLNKSTEQKKHLDDGESYYTSQDEVRAMEKAAVKLRDRLMIRLCWQTGLRRIELSGLKVDDVQRPPDDREVNVRSEVAKNDEQRIIPYQSSLDGLLIEWLDDGGREKYKDNEDCDYLFLSEHDGGLEKDSVDDIFKKAADRAEINRVLYTDSMERERAKIATHNVRKGYGNYLVHETDADIYSVSKLMGHKSVSVTEDMYIEDSPRSGYDVGKKHGPD